MLEAQRHWIEQLERDPIEFLAPERSLLPRLETVRELIAGFIAANASDLAFVRNSTDGVNAVLRSFPLVAGDVILVTSHGYNACNNAARFAAERAGAEVVTVPLPFPIESEQAIEDALAAHWHPRTRLLMIDHVTSPTALVLPVQRLVQLAHDRGARVLVDGSHAPGMVSVDLAAIDADYYTANHHKWWCGPKSSGFLHVKPQWQAEVHPTVISHGANRDAFGPSRFLGEFNWTGTYDPSPILSMPTAIEFLSGLYEGGLAGLMQRNRELALAGRDLLLQHLGIDQPPAPDSMIGSIASIPFAPAGSLSNQHIQQIHDRLYHKHKIELPVYPLDNGLPCLRISAQAYNDLSQYERLAKALNSLLYR